MATKEVTIENFQSEVLECNVPVLVDFWASWCGPCRMLAPVVAEIAEEHAADLKVGKINVDEQPELAAQFGVSSIPTVILFKNGEPVRGSVGYVPKERLEAMLNEQ